MLTVKDQGSRITSNLSLRQILDKKDQKFEIKTIRNRLTPTPPPPPPPTPSKFSRQLH